MCNSRLRETLPSLQRPRRKQTMCPQIGFGRSLPAESPQVDPAVAIKMYAFAFQQSPLFCGLWAAWRKADASLAVDNALPGYRYASR